ncbi:FMN-binding negative transcriptional regulator [Streptomyces sp. VRA16 Mangrove soil]|uniref:FMN-binding negative transcriptional regulator n=1 Tax=Streptomyces sp. VRA16 Mangrove soil TaxID=2817434 RepID=UPI001A9CC9E5|nr:FMN-binding negative transcriptional regulator [Streptomyces sp. VRA16 Mangrove soil]MBO1337299.1 FMN-binding negative transcriptional regulator [Streptomyces sp. VRA16 Mangrove soil]
MLIHPWDAARSDAEWQQWLAVHDFGQLAVNGLPGEPPFVQPMHFAYDAERGEVLAHLARPNPVWPALDANPEVLLSVVDDYAYVQGPWQALPGDPPEHGTPTSFYAAVQLRCTARVVDDPAEKAELLNRQLGHFQPPGMSATVAADEGPYARRLPGIRGLRLQVTDVRAKFKYGGNKPEEVQDRIAEGLAERGRPLDAAALAVQLRRRREA